MCLKLANFCLQTSLISPEVTLIHHAPLPSAFLFFNLARYIMTIIKILLYLVILLPIFAEDIDTSVTPLKRFTCETFTAAVYNDRTRPWALVGQTVIITFSHRLPVVYTPYNNPGMTGPPRVFGKILSSKGAAVSVSAPFAATLTSFHLCRFFKCWTVWRLHQAPRSSQDRMELL